jgi:flagellar motor switch protein FliG
MASMLNRFRKKGGFLQLVQLIETTEVSKQKNLLHLVGQEDPGWAHLVRTKTLSTQRIFSWSTDVLYKILPELHIQQLAVLYVTGNDERRAKILASIPSLLVRQVQDFSITSEVAEAQRFSAEIKLIQLVRNMHSEGALDFNRFDPSLVIEASLVAS